MSPGARSRGCEACQRRKIKCDGKTPMCGKCERLGIACTGPKEGPIILAYDPQKKLQKTQALTAAPKVLVGSDSPSASPFLALYNTRTIGAISNGPAIQECLTLKLQDCVSIPHQQHDSIVSELAVLSSSIEYPILQRAVWATSMALGGVATNSPDLLKRSGEIYADALRSLMREISGPIDREDDKQLIATRGRHFTVEMVGAAVLFVWYEALIGNNPNGWIAHALGAGRLLLLRNPKDYTLGLSHSVFRTTRYIMANASIMTVQTTPFGTHPWLNDPFSFIPKTSFDRVTDFWHIITRPLAWINERCMTGLPIPLGIEAAEVLQEVHVLEQGLTDFLVDYEQEMIVAGKPGLFHDIKPDRIDSTGQYYPKVRHYFSDQMAECVTHYEMSRLLICLMKAAFCNGDEFIVCRDEAVDYSASVLAAILAAESTSSTGMAREKFGFICVLITLVLSSPSKEHREYARLTLESWGSGGGLIGASAYHPVVRWKALTTIWREAALTPYDIDLLLNSGQTSDIKIVY